MQVEGTLLKEVAGDAIRLEEAAVRLGRVSNAVGLAGVGSGCGDQEVRLPPTPGILLSEPNTAGPGPPTWAWGLGVGIGKGKPRVKHPSPEELPRHCHCSVRG